LEGVYLENRCVNEARETAVECGVTEAGSRESRRRGRVSELLQRVVEKTLETLGRAVEIAKRVAKRVVENQK
jgi:hypothetical protein